MSDDIFLTIIILVLLEEYAWNYESEWAMMSSKSRLFLNGSGIDSTTMESIKESVLHFLA